jgi:hypothetical protein
MVAMAAAARPELCEAARSNLLLHYSFNEQKQIQTQAEEIHSRGRSPPSRP